MAVTIVVRSRGAEGAVGEDARELSLTLDTPRLVIGRSEGCEVRLPDPSVSHRHASIRQRGGEYVIVDEGSSNGTFLDRVRLPPQTPRAVRSGELVRVGRVWLEVRLEPALVKGNTAAAAKELALDLVSRGLVEQGEQPWPIVNVVDGPDQGKTLVIAEVGRRYVLGRSRDADLALDDRAASRRHVEIARRGDALVVQDLGTAAGAFIDSVQLAPGDVVWRAGQELAFGGNRLAFVYPAAEALAELDRSPDERMRPGEISEPPPAPDAPEDTPAPDVAAPAAGDATPTPDPVAAAIQRSNAKPRARAEGGGWGFADGVVALIALGVIALSILGALWLFGR